MDRKNNSAILLMCLLLSTSFSCATYYSDLGHHSFRKGEYDKALEFLKQALRLDLKNYSREHPILAVRYNNLGWLYDKKGEYDRALEYFQKAQKIDLEKLGTDHPNVAIRYNNIGLAHYGKAEYNIVLDYYLKGFRNWAQNFWA